MVGVNIGRNFEYKASKLRLIRVDSSFFSNGGARVGGYLYKAVKQLFYTKIVQSRTKKYRSYISI